MKGSELLLVVLAAALIAGCASAPNSNGGASAASEDKVYATGSRIPQKDAPPPQATNRNTIDTVFRRAQVCSGGPCGGN